MSRGAPKQFDRDAALDQAMHLFWKQGYSQTGVADLTRGMGIGRQSLYDTFGDKKNLFLEAVERYWTHVMVQVRDLLDAPGSPLANVKKTLRFYEQHNTNGQGLGCMLLNSMAELGDDEPEIDEPLKERLTALERAYQDALARAQDEGELRKDANVRALARSTLATISGCCIMGRVGMPKAMVRDALRMHERHLQAFEA